MRARELCERLGDSQELFSALYGLWSKHSVRGELEVAYGLAEQLLRQAERTHDPALLLYGRVALGNTSYFMGKFLLAREHLEMAVSMYDPENHGQLALLYGFDAGVNCLSYAAWILWQLGHPDQALQRGNEALALAQKLFHPLSLAWAEFFVGFVHQNRHEQAAAKAAAERVIALATERQFSIFLAYGTGLRGWAVAAQGSTEEGIAQIHQSMAALRATGTELARPRDLCLLAEAYIKTSRFEEALAALMEALAVADGNEIHFYEAETYRLKGELLLRQSDPNAAEAQKNFERAIEVARKQNAKSFELRATTSLAGLVASQGHRDEARTMLADIYGWFTEGFDTADLKDAKALLEELAA